MDDLEEKLAGTRVENENGSIDGFGGQISLKGFVNRHTIHICVIHKPAK
jgi:hypothetical protein